MNDYSAADKGERKLQFIKSENYYHICACLPCRDGIRYIQYVVGWEDTHTANNTNGTKNTDSSKI